MAKKHRAPNPAQTNQHEDEDRFYEGLTTTLTGHLYHLRSIKRMEMSWLNLFTVLIAPAIGFLTATNGMADSLSENILLVMMVVYLLIVGWIQDVLRIERRSYYRVLRSTVRAQTLLGLFHKDPDKRFLADVLSNAPFPKDYGPNPNEDGTQPFGTFFHRQIYTIVLFAALLVSVCYRANWSRWILLVGITVLFLDVGWIVIIYVRDRVDLKKDTCKEVGRLGYPSPPD